MPDLFISLLEQSKAGNRKVTFKTIKRVKLLKSHIDNVMFPRFDRWFIIDLHLPINLKVRIMYIRGD